MQNRIAGSFNDRMYDESLNEHLFDKLSHACNLANRLQPSPPTHKPRLPNARRSEEDQNVKIASLN